LNGKADPSLHPNDEDLSLGPRFAQDDKSTLCERPPVWVVFAFGTNRDKTMTDGKRGPLL